MAHAQVMRSERVRLARSGAVRRLGAIYANGVGRGCGGRGEDAEVVEG